MTNQLTPRQQKFIAAWQMGVDGTAAAVAAGYKPKAARWSAWNLLNNNKLVMAEVKRLQAGLAKAAEYNGEKCMAECDAAITFAQKTQNANALARLIELKAKLTGLLREKLDITMEHKVNIGDALAQAKERALRPSCDPAPAIEGEFVALPGVPDTRAIDSQSIAGAGFAMPVDHNL